MYWYHFKFSHIDFNKGYENILFKSLYAYEKIHENINETNRVQ